MQHVEIYTDGGCLGNPGRGGYGAILACGEHRRELSGGYQHTTNNRMEMMACIVALEALKRECAVTVYSDSKYLVDGVSKGWAVKWKRNNWKRSGGDTGRECGSVGAVAFVDRKAPCQIPVGERS